MQRNDLQKYGQVSVHPRGRKAELAAELFVNVGRNQPSGRIFRHPLYSEPSPKNGLKQFSKPTVALANPSKQS